jgi:hypothetical protein
LSTQEYLQALLDSQIVTEGELSVLRELRRRIEARLSVFDGNPRFYYAGSYGKNTMIRENYDLDIIMYWPSNTTYNIKGIYDAVGEQLKKEFTKVVPKTVCWEIPFQDGFHVDVVPGRALDTGFKEANLHRTDTGTTLKTSIKTHIDTVRSSGRRDAIRLIKLWRERKRVPFKKSFLLEMMTINGCNSTSYTNLHAQTLATLEYISGNIETVQIKDPANSNNSLSDDISAMDKAQIKMLAQAAINTPYWTQVFEKA